MAIEGVDYSYDHPTVAQLKAAGKTFACRYLTGTTTAAPGSKNLTPSEAAALQAGGIDIVSNYETSEGFMLEGYDSGAKRAAAAWKQHKWCGGPDGRPIYFSLDLNATYDQWKQAKEFLKGAASALTVFSPRVRRPSIARRVGSANAANVVLRWSDSNLIIWLINS